MSKARNWTLTEDRPDYFNAQVTERILTLNLSIRRSSGLEERLGQFRIDLDDLAARGFANRHEEAGRTRYVVQINHVGGRDFNLGVRVGQTTPLAPFAVR